MSRAVDNLVGLLGAKRSGAGWKALCPAHNDSDPSLSISERDDGKGAVLHCHAGCSTDEVLTAIGKRMSDLFDDDPKPATSAVRREVAAYPYVDEIGEVLYQVVRFEPKDFRQRRPNGRGGWDWSLNGTRRVLYRLPDVVAGVASGRRIYVAEGEKDVDALVNAGEIATCAPQGAGKWSKVPDAPEVLRGADVVVVADRDEHGRAHAAEIARSLDGVASRVSVVEAAIGKDAADHLGAGKTVAEFVEVGQVDPPVEPSSFDPVDLRPILAGDYVQPLPTLLRRRNDTVDSCLLYREAINGVHGDSGTGKGWLSVLLLAEQMAAGETVMLLDLEDTPGSIVSRLRLIGVTDDEIAQRLIYIRPTETFLPSEVDRLVDRIHDQDIAAVIVDSLGEAFAIDGINEDRDNEVGPWMRGVLRPLADAGAAVLVIDHSTKAADGSLHPSGSKRKRAAIGGASYLIEAVTPFVKGGSGRLRLVCAKDRHGTYRRGQHVAWLDLTTNPDETITLELIAPAELDGEAPANVASLLAARAAVAAAKEAGKPLSLRALRAGMSIKASNETRTDGIELAAARGALQEEAGPRNSRQFTYIRDLDQEVA